MKNAQTVLVLTMLLFISFCELSISAQEDYYQENYIRNSDFVYKKHIKSVQMYKEGFEMSIPVVRLNTNERLVFSFDDMDGDYKKYDYTIVHCNANWEESDLMANEYLESFTDDYIDDFQFSVNTMQKYTHYREVFPNDLIMYRLPGNYLLKVFNDGNPEDIVLTRRFFVQDPAITLNVMVKGASEVSQRDHRQELNFSLFPQGLSIVDPNREIIVTVQQNGRWDNAITDLTPRIVIDGELRYDNLGACVFDGSSDFRYFDMKSLRYNSFRVKSIEYYPDEGYQVYLHPDEVKKKNVYQYVQESMNGNFLIKTEDMNYSDFESDYATVHFTLPYEMPLIQGKMYVMGGFTSWQFLKEAELVYDYGETAYKAEFLLKQGFYNYQYVMLPNDSKIGDVTVVEGNFFETNNEYTFYVYYRPRGGRFDRLVLVQTILAHPN